MPNVPECAAHDHDDEQSRQHILPPGRPAEPKPEHQQPGQSNPEKPPQDSDRQNAYRPSGACACIFLSCSILSVAFNGSHSRFHGLNRSDSAFSATVLLRKHAYSPATASGTIASRRLGNFTTCCVVSWEPAEPPILANEVDPRQRGRSASRAVVAAGVGRLRRQRSSSEPTRTI